ncbi:hypothetical protein HDU83_005495 [Entophlyctis luteolus]|nr:hypothetical protein HDU83_005495 [Entophlyctis luteolus]
MDSSNVPTQLKALFSVLLSTNAAASAAAITAHYDRNARLTNPYLVGLLNGRDEIVKSYASLIAANLDIDGQINSIRKRHYYQPFLSVLPEYDPATQKATLSLIQISQPKALGGLIPVRINQTLELQLEATDPTDRSKLYIVLHTEKHTAQEYLSQLPVLGDFYETQLRSAVGQLTLAGGEVLEKYHVLDAVPVAVDKAKSAVESASKMASETAKTASQRANDTVISVTRIATSTKDTAMGIAASTASKARYCIKGVHSAANHYFRSEWTASTAKAAGLTTLLDSTVNWIQIARGTVNEIVFTTKETAQMIGSTAKDVAASLIEEGKGVNVSCYSPTCKPGQVCYAPTCARGRTLSVNLTVDNFQSIVRGMYLEGQKTAGMLTTIE